MGQICSEVPSKQQVLEKNFRKCRIEAPFDSTEYTPRRFCSFLENTTLSTEKLVAKQALLKKGTFSSPQSPV